MDTVIERRIEAVRRRLAEAPFDTLLVLTQENRRYLSGFTGEDTHFDESAGCLFINGDHLLLATDSRYLTQAEHEAPHFQIQCYKQSLVSSLPGILEQLGVRKLGLEAARLSLKDHRQMQERIAAEGGSVELVPWEGMVEGCRVTKDEGEIDAIRAALHLAESVFQTVLGRLGPGMTEKEVAWAMEKEMRERGAQSLAFPTIVAGGPHSAMPHAVPTDRPIRSGEPLLFDWGARLDGYCSDISRTVAPGNGDGTFRMVLETVREAQQRAIDAIRPGKSTQEIDGVARAHIAARGFGERFGHGLGHGVGLAVHEDPRVSPVKPSVLEVGMVFTVEPGIYLPGWGGVRLENLVVVREHGAEVLNGLESVLVV